MMSFVGADVGAAVVPGGVGAVGGAVVGLAVGPWGLGAIVGAGDRGRIMSGRYPAGNRFPVGHAGLGKSRPLPLSSRPMPVPR